MWGVAFQVEARLLGESGEAAEVSMGEVMSVAREAFRRCAFPCLPFPFEKP
jgi:hypothetical protein